MGTKQARLGPVTKSMPSSSLSRHTQNCKRRKTLAMWIRCGRIPYEKSLVSSWEGQERPEDGSKCSEHNMAKLLGRTLSQGKVLLTD